jgi:hypothetical protein
MSTNTSSAPTHGFTIITDCYVYLVTWLMATDAMMLTFQLLAHRADVDRHQCTCARERLLSAQNPSQWSRFAACSALSDAARPCLTYQYPAQSRLAMGLYTSIWVLHAEHGHRVDMPPSETNPSALESGALIAKAPFRCFEYQAMGPLVGWLQSTGKGSSICHTHHTDNEARQGPSRATRRRH